jgi:DNA repair protein RecO (recombination protein O)|tara:strand:+ start:592 stop:1272 length:681 start_codon:yes stop_codon:yes gene_type:complete
MIWDDKGFLLSKFKYSENSVIADFFTTEHGKSSGIIFGASSKRIKGYLQIGNKFQLNYQSKNENKIGSFKVEIIKAETPLFFNDRSKLHCISSSMSMVKLLTAENQKNPEIFNLIEKFFILIKKNNWLMEYIIWELELLKLSGYDLNLSKIVKKTIENNKSKYFVESQTEKKIVPNFLVENNNEVADKNDLIRGIQIVTSYLDKNILQPNNLNHPLQRVDFINTLK